MDPCFNAATMSLLARKPSLVASSDAKDPSITYDLLPPPWGVPKNIIPVLFQSVFCIYAGKLDRFIRCLPNWQIVRIILCIDQCLQVHDKSAGQVKDGQAPYLFNKNSAKAVA